MSRFDRDPDALYDDDVVAYIRLAVRRNGAMSVDGCINDEAYALAMIDNARDTIRRHNARRRLALGETLVIPEGDTGIKIT